MNLCLFVHNTLFSESIHQVFQILYMKLENNRGSKVAKPEVLGKFLFFQKWANWAKNGSNGFFRVFQKYWHHFLLKIIQNERFYDSIFSCTNPLSGKMLLHKLQVKMLLFSQVARFFDVTDVKESFNILDLLDKDSHYRKVSTVTVTFG